MALLLCGDIHPYNGKVFWLNKPIESLNDDEMITNYFHSVFALLKLYISNLLFLATFPGDKRLIV